MKPTPNQITLNLDGDAEVAVKGFIAPIEYTKRNYHVDWDELANLRVAEQEKEYPASVFQAFLPQESVSVGECWKIDEEGALTLLRQLNPRPQLDLEIGGEDSYGLWACLRAYNDAFAEILFRIHAEFVLEKGWFTPSQFAGYMVIDRIEKRVVAFKMHVPAATLNFDVRWRIFGEYLEINAAQRRVGFVHKWNSVLTHKMFYKMTNSQKQSPKRKHCTH